jgi:hypothetical protein
MVQGHTLKSAIKVSSKNPKEPWDELKEEYSGPSEIVEVADLNIQFIGWTFAPPKGNLTEWIEKLYYNNERGGISNQSI